MYGCLRLIFLVLRAPLKLACQWWFRNYIQLGPAGKCIISVQFKSIYSERLLQELCGEAHVQCVLTDRHAWLLNQEGKVTECHGLVSKVIHIVMEVWAQYRSKHTLLMLVVPQSVCLLLHSLRMGLSPPKKKKKWILLEAAAVVIYLMLLGQWMMDILMGPVFANKKFYESRVDFTCLGR